MTAATVEVQTGASVKAGYGEFRAGWQVVLASFLGISLGLSPMPFYTMGIFAPHLAKAFHWSIGDVMGGLTITTLMVLWAGPLVGWIATKVGVRRVALTSQILFGLAFMSLALSNGSLPLFYFTWAVIAGLGAGTLPITWTKGVNNWFDVRKGLALGISLMGTGLFGIFCKPYVNWLVDMFGWRWGYVGLGILPLLVAFPIAYFLFDEGDRNPRAPRRAAAPGGLTLGQAVRAWRFWLLAAALVPVSFALSGPVPNLEVILRNAKLPPPVILGLTPLVGLSALVGRIAGGWLLDRFWAPAVGFVILSLPGISCWLLAADSIDYVHGAIAILLIGFALGVEYDLMAFFVCRYFGMRSYASIYGLLYVFFSFGSGLGPFVFGRVYDISGSYDRVLIASFFILLAGSAALLLLGRYRTFEDEAPAR